MKETKNIITIIASCITWSANTILISKFLVSWHISSSTNHVTHRHSMTRDSAQHQFQFQCYSSTLRAQGFFFRKECSCSTATSPVFVCADSVAMFPSSICNSFMCWRFLFYLFMFFFSITCNFICINFVYLYRCQCHELLCTDRPLPD